ncbi:MAG: 8-amino-7-oxononanoate synthase [Pirellulaceae bacterium]|nr:8-amino-7-oxononanoate synthase [Pirellulaceae bacterium]
MSVQHSIHEWLNSLPEDQLRHLRNVTPLAAGRIELEGRAVIDFASNDYLGLAHHPELIARATHWMQDLGAGARASRLISGNFGALTALEQKLARAKGSESALIFGSGFQVNSAVLAALLQRHLHQSSPIRVFTDRLCHASFHFGLASSGVKQSRYRHNDLKHLEELLETGVSQSESALIATESVFSMEGDQLNVEQARELAKKYDALLYVDEAHATGLFGPWGMGLMAASGGSKDYPASRSSEVVIGTFGKALGSYGAYVACSDEIRNYLINRCAGLIYSTGLPPSVLGAIDAALDLVPEMEDERVHLRQLSERLRVGLQAMGLNTLQSDSQIIPILLPENSTVLEVAKDLLDSGYLVGAIRPPTVPPGSARLRVSLSAAHTFDQVDHFLQAMQRNISSKVTG